ncbi:bifunctional phosphatase IMPL2 [Pseudoscourfieldia marina]
MAALCTRSLARSYRNFTLAARTAATTSTQRTTRGMAAPAATSSTAETVPLPSGARELAMALADTAAETTKPYFRARNLVRDTKSDASPVTVADRAAEMAMRKLIEQTFPDHGVFGEEAGYSGAPDASYVWILDPIDGTKSFITGKPLFVTLIALTCEGKPCIGVIDQPVIGERWVGASGHPTTCNGEQVRCDDVEVKLSDAYVFATTPKMFDGSPETRRRFDAMSSACREVLYGCDGFAYGLVASGHADAVCEADLGVYDAAALVPVLEGAGGVITDWQGESLRFDPSILVNPETSGDKLTVLATRNGALHKEALLALE